MPHQVSSGISYVLVQLYVLLVCMHASQSPLFGGEGSLEVPNKSEAAANTKKSEAAANTGRLAASEVCPQEERHARNKTDDVPFPGKQASCSLFTNRPSLPPPPRHCTPVSNSQSPAPSGALTTAPAPMRGPCSSTSTRRPQRDSKAAQKRPDDQRSKKK